MTGGFTAFQRGLLDAMRGNIPRNPYTDKADRNSYYRGYEAGRQHKKSNKLNWGET